MSRVSDIADRVLESFHKEPNTEVEVWNFSEIEDIVRDVMRQKETESYMNTLPDVIWSWSPGQYSHLSAETLTYIWEAIKRVQPDLPGGSKQYNELREAIENLKGEVYQWPNRPHFPIRYVVRMPGESGNTETRLQAPNPLEVEKRMTPERANQRRRAHQEKVELQKKLKDKHLAEPKRSSIEKQIDKLDQVIFDQDYTSYKALQEQNDADIQFRFELREVYARVLDRKDRELEQPIEKFRRTWGSLRSRLLGIEAGYRKATKHLAVRNWPPKKETEFDILIEVYGPEVLDRFQNSELPEKYQRSEAEEEKLNWLE